MRPLKSHFRDDALTTLETVLKQTKEARVFRRAQAVRPFFSASPNKAWSRRPPASAALPLPAAPMQHGARQQAPHHASPPHSATSAASAGG